MHFWCAEEGQDLEVILRTSHAGNHHSNILLEQNRNLEEVFI